MKKILIFTTVALTLGLLSCNKVLDKEDPTAVFADELWSSNVLTTAYLDKCYTDALPEWSEVPAADCDESQGDGTKFLINGLNDNAMTYWPYDNIYRINILLHSLDKGTLTSAQKELIRGQAFFLRAYLYFEMVKRYGGVPLILKPQDRFVDSLEVPRNKTSECIKQICADLDSAAIRLPGIWTKADVGRIFKGAAMAFKGRVLMFYASTQFTRTKDLTRWQAAYDANDAAKKELDLSGYGLSASFKDIWANVTKESLIMTRYKFPSRVHKFEGGLRPQEYSTNASGYNQPSWDLVKAFPMKDGTDPGVVVGSVKKAFDPTKKDTTGLFWIGRDPRFYETVVYNGAPLPIGGLNWPEKRMFTYKGAEVSLTTTKTGFYCRKFVQDGKTSYDCLNGTLAWIEMRYAEVLLNLAECAAELGGKDQVVYDQLISIRKRAGITANGDNLYGLKASMTQTELVNAVRFEKRIEFAMECKRFWDMRRWGLFRQAPFASNYKRQRCIYDKTTAYADPNYKRDELIPIVANEKTVNSTLYFTYFAAKVENVDSKNFAVTDKYYFYTPESKHFNQNKKMQSTDGGWTNLNKYGLPLFNPLD